MKKPALTVHNRTTDHVSVIQLPSWYIYTQASATLTAIHLSDTTCIKVLFYSRCYKVTPVFTAPVHFGQLLQSRFTEIKLTMTGGVLSVLGVGGN